MDLKKYLKSDLLRWLLAGLAIIIVLLLVLQLGIFIGVHKVKFSYGWADAYGRNFGGPRGILPNLDGREFFGGHGLTGSVIRIDGDKIIIKGDDSKEKIVATDSKTVIRRGRQDLTVANLKTDESIVVIGSPNQDGSIQAKIIRLLDPSDFPRTPMKLPFMGGPR